ncbi:MAG: hypothetical protein JWO54_991 [Candidatus Saccharibacteria bacterium]|nr:hypothetical protein [Candidatus Saccharibacteria bacterium]
MATVKKPFVKKTVTTKKAPIHKASAKAPVKVRSFHVSPNDPTFPTFKITRQTVYWVIIVSFIIFVQLWILSLQLETSNYIEAETSAIQ